MSVYGTLLSLVASIPSMDNFLLSFILDNIFTSGDLLYLFGNAPLFFFASDAWTNGTALFILASNVSTSNTLLSLIAGRLLFFDTGDGFLSAIFDNIFCFLYLVLALLYYLCLVPNLVYIIFLFFCLLYSLVLQSNLLKKDYLIKYLKFKCLLLQQNNIKNLN